MLANNRITQSARYFLLSAMMIPLLFAQAAAQDSPHAMAYAGALQRLLNAPDRLLAEMHRIHRGEVAHFDFLQHEHIELIRDARALRFPPSTLEDVLRGALKSQAEQVLTMATALELTLADFLRSQALVNAALSSTLDIAAMAAEAETDPDSRAVLSRLGEAAIGFRRTADASSQESLLRAFDAVAALPMDSRYQAELSLQRQLIDDNAGSVKAILSSSTFSDLARSARKLAGLYEESEVLLVER